MNILASDDGHGVLSFNGSRHTLLKEPTSASGPGEGVATLAVLRSPEEGTFGTVTVTFSITDGNGSLAEADLRPAQGTVVLEHGVRFKVRARSARPYGLHGGYRTGLPVHTTCTEDIEQKECCG